jgi:hypothetical protein
VQDGTAYERGVTHHGAAERHTAAGDGAQITTWCALDTEQLKARTIQKPLFNAYLTTFQRDDL